MSQILNDNEIETWVKTRPGWTYAFDKKALCREFGFAGFSEAFGFMTRVAMAAEKLDHHPDWSNAFNRVHVCLSTHTAGGVTQSDFALAAAMDAIYKG